jgi:hypothetical protein
LAATTFYSARLTGQKEKEPPFADLYGIEIVMFGIISSESLPIILLLNV